jgi:hypothetical protein
MTFLADLTRSGGIPNDPADLQGALPGLPAPRREAADSQFRETRRGDRIQVKPPRQAVALLNGAEAVLWQGSGLHRAQAAARRAGDHRLVRIALQEKTADPHAHHVLVKGNAIQNEAPPALREDLSHMLPPRNAARGVDLRNGDIHRTARQELRQGSRVHRAAQGGT